jgi:hypothetical protein
MQEHTPECTIRTRSITGLELTEDKTAIDLKDAQQLPPRCRIFGSCQSFVTPFRHNGFCAELIRFGFNTTARQSIYCLLLGYPRSHGTICASNQASRIRTVARAEGRCGLSSIAGVPNGRLRQHYRKAALEVTSQETVAVDRFER